KQQLSGKQKKTLKAESSSVHSSQVATELFEVKKKAPTHVRDTIKTVLAKAAAAGKNP
ncbi:hypothetical protein F441_15687, partial [Phytophthora nicotianae CJ01A1]